jgi:alkanesulfonate monooxygenase SsuD/methylene tetrahydromethanopterin reductase-like flavin-dependent oxidoreductase (luciferase family)
MVGVELSCGLPPGPDFADLAVLAEELGYARVWIFDSAPLWEDPFVHLALAGWPDDADRFGHRSSHPFGAFRYGDGIMHRDYRSTLR